MLTGIDSGITERAALIDYVKNYDGLWAADLYDSPPGPDHRHCPAASLIASPTIRLVETMGIEPTTLGLQSRCSAN